VNTGGGGAAAGGAGVKTGAGAAGTGTASGDIATAAGMATGTAVAPPSGKTWLHTLQRARTPPAGTLAGSTRNTVSQDGQETFTRSPR